MNFFSQLQAHFQQLNARLTQLRGITANLPQESGVWVNGQKVSSLPNLPMATQTTVTNGNVVTQTINQAAGHQVVGVSGGGTVTAGKHTASIECGAQSLAAQAQSGHSNITVIAAG